MNIAIVGKDSYIGTSFEKHMLNSGDYNIITIDSRNTPVENMDFTNIDVVLHVAGIAHVSAKKNMKDLYFKVNRDLAINTALKAKQDGVKQFIFMSSMIIYGDDAKIGKTKVITKDTIPNPSNAYGQSKLEADHYIQSLNDDNFKTVVIRTPMVYGPNCKGNFPRLVKLALRMPFFPNIKNERSMIYIYNLCELLKIIIEYKEFGAFYPQNSEYVSTVDIVKIVREMNNKKVRFTRIFNTLIKIASIFINTFNKVFGNKIYNEELSSCFDNHYNIVSFSDSLREIYNVEKDNK